MAAELVAASEGLGWMINDARRSFRADVVVLGMLSIATLGHRVNLALVCARRRLLRWHIRQEAR